MTTKTMELRRSSFDFAPSSGTILSASETLTFPRQVLQATVGILGYTAGFDDEDHHFGRLIVKLGAQIDAADNTKVNVSSSFGLRDWSGDFDDAFIGSIQWIVIAELIPVNQDPGNDRGDLIILDAEITQAIQHFRSSRHLDAPNVFPDNSIRLVEKKPTAVRLYIDYDRNSGLPPVNRLSGTLEINDGKTTQTISPIADITPRRDININRGNAMHTLNFLIPESLCNGNVELKAKVFDAFDNTQFSADFERSIVFEKMPELRYIAVGLDYTGADVDADAPPESLASPEIYDFIAVLAKTEKIYPIPNTNLTSYLKVAYDGDLNSDISDLNEGCGDKFSDLLDFLEDYKGDSHDIVFGLLNTGVKSGSVGGCGRGSTGVIAGIATGQDIALHELGHALGRDHAPCDNVVRCAEPADTDDDYPKYSGYASDSIGEYGFDGINNKVLSPGNTYDLMGYSGNLWVSPYTYKALMSKIPTIFPTAGLQARTTSALLRRNQDNEWIRIKTPHIFLRIDIDYKRNVKFQTAFCFDSLPRPHGNVKTDFTVAFLDKNGNVIGSYCLYRDSGCSCCCTGTVLHSPIKIRQGVSFPKGSKTLIISECDKEIYREDIPDLPEVKVSAKGNNDPNNKFIVLEWNVSSTTEGKDFMFLVQWRDRSGTWRGCAPRTGENTLKIPKRLLDRQRDAAIRVLASSGIATGVGVWEGKVEYASTGKPGNYQVDIQLVGVPATGDTRIKIPSFIKAVPIFNDTKTENLSEIVWYNDKGVEIGRGPGFNLKKLSYGETYLKASVLDSGQGSGNNQWLIERNRNDEFYILRGDIERKKPC